MSKLSLSPLKANHRSLHIEKHLPLRHYHFNSRLISLRYLLNYRVHLHHSYSFINDRLLLLDLYVFIDDHGFVGPKPLPPIYATPALLNKFFFIFLFDLLRQLSKFIVVWGPLLSRGIRDICLNFEVKRDLEWIKGELGQVRYFFFKAVRVVDSELHLQEV